MAEIIAMAVRRARKVWTEPRAIWEMFEYGYLNRVRWALRRWLMPLSSRSGRRSLAMHGALADLEAYNAKRPPSSFEPDYYDLWHLYRDVISDRPRRLLEYGSGQSTVIMASALAANVCEGGPKGHLTTLESEEQWATINRDAIPEHLREYVTVIHSPRRIISRLEIRFSHAPVGDPDFVYLDGPDHPDHSMASLDLLDLEPTFPANFRLVVDGRTFNKNQLLRRFKRRYRQRWRGLMSNDTVITLKE